MESTLQLQYIGIVHLVFSVINDINECYFPIIDFSTIQATKVTKIHQDLC